MHTKCSMYCRSGFTSLLTTVLSSSPTWVSTEVVNSFGKQPWPPPSQARVLSEQGMHRLVVGNLLDAEPDFIWSKPPWPPLMLVEILGCQVEDSIIKLRPTPWSSFSCNCYQVEVQSKEQWGLRYCNLRYGEVFLMMGDKSNEDVLVHLAEMVHYSVCLQILCQLPVYTREDTSASLELLKGYDIFGFMRSELVMFNSSDQFISSNGVTREPVVVMECAWCNKILVLQCLISDVVPLYPGTLLCFVGSIEHHQCKCLEIAHIRKEAITQNSVEGFAGNETSRLWVSECLLPGNHMICSHYGTSVDFFKGFKPHPPSFGESFCSSPNADQIVQHFSMYSAGVFRYLCN